MHLTSMFPWRIPLLTNGKKVEARRASGRLGIGNAEKDDIVATRFQLAGERCHGIEVSRDAGSSEADAHAGSVSIQYGLRADHRRQSRKALSESR